MRLHVIGNSHVTALESARLRCGENVRTRFDGVDISFVAPARFERVSFARVEGEAVELSLRDSTAGLGELTDLRSITGEDVWGICMGLHTMAITRERFWNSHEPAHIAAPDASPVSDALMAAILHGFQRHVFELLSSMKAVGIPSFVVSSPPLRRDHVSVSWRRPEVTLEIDRMARASMRRFLTMNDIGFVDYPPEAMAEDGFLRADLHQEYRADGAPDTHHGNAEYGQMMLRRVIEHAEDAFLDTGHSRDAASPTRVEARRGELARESRPRVDWEITARRRGRRVET